MRKLLTGVVISFVLFTPLSSFAAIAFDSALNVDTHSGSPSSPVTDTFNNAAGTLVVIGALDRTQGDLMTGCSYNGVSGVLVSKFNSTAAGSWIYVYKVTSPATGSHTVSCSFSGAPSDVRVGAVSYSGASDIETFNTGTQASATSWTGSITTLTNNDWVGAWVMNDATNNVFTSPAMARGNANDPSFGDSNAVITPAGSYSIGGTAGGSSATTGWILFAICPASCSAGSVFRPAFSNVYGFW